MSINIKDPIECSITGSAGYATSAGSAPASDVYAWAKAATKPSYAFSEITDKPTTLAGYGISDAFFLHTTSNYLGVRFANGEYATGDKYLEWWNSAGWVNHMSAKYIVAGATSSHFLKGDGSLDNTAYLPLSGGTISGALTLQNSIVVSSGADRKLVLNNTDTESKYQFISFMQENLEYGKLGTAGTDDLRWNNNIVLHSGNIGSQTVAKSTETRRFETILVTSSDNRDLNTALFGGGLMRNYSGYASSYFTNHPEGMLYGCVIEFSAYGTSQSKNDLAAQLAWDVNHRGSDSTRNLWWRVNDDRNFANAKWHQIAFVDSNVASATKLQTARTIWGQSFDGTGDVSGDMSNVGVINSFIKPTKGSSSVAYLHITNFLSNEYDGIHMYIANKDNSNNLRPIVLQHGFGNVLIGTLNDNGYKLEVNGTLKAGASTLASLMVSGNLEIGTTDNCYIALKRNNLNYFHATGTEGYIGFVTNAKGSSRANCDLLIQNTLVCAGTTEYTDLGSTTYRWKGINAKTLNLSSDAKISGEMDANALVIPTAPPTNPQPGKHYLYLA